MKERLILLHLTTIPNTLGFLRGQVGYMESRGFEVHALSSPGERLERFAKQEGTPVYAVEMARQITPLQDLRALYRIWRVLRRLRPTLVHAHTPKAGLLGMLGAWLARVPVRIYHIRGLPLLTATGYRRALLRWTENVACSRAHRVLCVSHSVREVAVREGLCPPEKIAVLCHGSSNGVDAEERFHPERGGWAARERVRQDLEIPEGGLVIGFVGRLVGDKGVRELAEAWEALREEFPETYLLVVGRLEEPRDPIPPETLARLREDARVRLAGQALPEEMPAFYAALDLLALPTYREGFPNVPLEAAAMRLPVVATQVPGCVDAVEDGVTGTLVPPRDAAALAEALRAYLRDPELRRRHGTAGRERALRDFRPEAIWEALYQEYARLLKERGLAVPATGAVSVACDVSGRTAPE